MKNLNGMKNLFGVFIIAALLIAGCTGNANNGSGQAKVGETVEKTQVESQTPKVAEENDGMTFDPSKMSEWDLSALTNSGMAIKCDVESETPAGTQKSTIYLKGDKIKSEALVGGKIFNSIIKGKAVYISNSGVPNCDWLMVSTESNGTKTVNVETEDGQKIPSDPTKTPPAKYSCAAGTFGDEKFDTPGKICDIIGMMGTTTTTTPAPSTASYCDSLTDPEQKSQCMQMYGSG